MRKGYIHHTRFIKTNNAVNLSRKPGLDFCCDLLQHLQGVLRTCRFFPSFSVFKLSYVHFARLRPIAIQSRTNAPTGRVDRN